MNLHTLISLSGSEDEKSNKIDREIQYRKYRNGHTN